MRGNAFAALGSTNTSPSISPATSPDLRFSDRLSSQPSQEKQKNSDDSTGSDKSWEKVGVLDAINARWNSVGPNSPTNGTASKASEMLNESASRVTFINANNNGSYMAHGTSALDVIGGNSLTSKISTMKSDLEAKNSLLFNTNPKASFAPLTIASNSSGWTTVVDKSKEKKDRTAASSPASTVQGGNGKSSPASAYDSNRNKNDNEVPSGSGSEFHSDDDGYNSEGELMMQKNYHGWSHQDKHSRSAKDRRRIGYNKEKRRAQAKETKR